MHSCGETGERLRQKGLAFHEGTVLRLTTDLFLGTVDTRRRWNGIFQIVRDWAPVSVGAGPPQALSGVTNDLARRSMRATRCGKITALSDQEVKNHLSAWETELGHLRIPFVVKQHARDTSVSPDEGRAASHAVGALLLPENKGPVSLLPPPLLSAPGFLAGTIRQVKKEQQMQNCKGKIKLLFPADEIHGKPKKHAARLPEPGPTEAVTFRVNLRERSARRQQ